MGLSCNATKSSDAFYRMTFHHLTLVLCVVRYLANSALHSDITLTTFSPSLEPRNQKSRPFQMASLGMHGVQDGVEINESTVCPAAREVWCLPSALDSQTAPPCRLLTVGRLSWLLSLRRENHGLQFGTFTGGLSRASTAMCETTAFEVEAA
ncbi:hypothetical protein BU23DRAFT_115154 [Bimuria novae-zelandiae CBS 107.79]|uniref:Uncharacterized protein n=1 Tax=Bimuria novae-zelandiae CBS 107.79 TaxID=1447943 RepID=A0A6A5VB13_9PLEO|nr:hypothetical protein BU23DRAFT_115154 [Bimuria novae-zelandiae CBS 107.79]